jgi:exodeoxyribonuclease VII large subunit
LQLIVENMRRTGQGAWFEQFLRLKAKLEAEGLFLAERKRPIPQRPRCIGVVTSLGAAALHDVATALQRRVPHIPVVLAPSPVQGADAAPALVHALQTIVQQPQVDVILLVRGGGSIEDLWSFNDETLARAIVHSPVPVIAGLGHETDFTIADFCADLRAPTPTAAAELCATPRQELLENLQTWLGVLQSQTYRLLDQHTQRLDHAQSRLGRPSQGVTLEKMQLMTLQQRLRAAAHAHVQREKYVLVNLKSNFDRVLQQTPTIAKERLQRSALRLELLDPKLVLKRGFSWLSRVDGQSISSVAQTAAGQEVHATLADGVVELQVTATRYI